MTAPHCLQPTLGMITGYAGCTCRCTRRSHVHGPFPEVAATSRYAGITVSWYRVTVEIHIMSVRIPEDQYEQLRVAAFGRRVAMNTLICEGIELRLAELKAAATEDQS